MSMKKSKSSSDSKNDEESSESTSNSDEIQGEPVKTPQNRQPITLAETPEPRKLVESPEQIKTPEGQEPVKISQNEAPIKVLDSQPEPVEMPESQESIKSPDTQKPVRLANIDDRNKTHGNQEPMKTPESGEQVKHVYASKPQRHLRSHDNWSDAIFPSGTHGNQIPSDHVPSNHVPTNQLPNNSLLDTLLDDSPDIPGSVCRTKDAIRKKLAQKRKLLSNRGKVGRSPAKRAMPPSNRKSPRNYFPKVGPTPSKNRSPRLSAGRSPRLNARRSLRLNTGRSPKLSAERTPNVRAASSPKLSAGRSPGLSAGRSPIVLVLNKIKDNGLNRKEIFKVNKKGRKGRKRGVQELNNNISTEQNKDDLNQSTEQNEDEQNQSTDSLGTETQSQSSIQFSPNNVSKEPDSVVSPMLISASTPRQSTPRQSSRKHTPKKVFPIENYTNSNSIDTSQTKTPKTPNQHTRNHQLNNTTKTPHRQSQLPGEFLSPLEPLLNGRTPHMRSPVVIRTPPRPTRVYTQSESSLMVTKVATRIASGDQTKRVFKATVSKDSPQLKKFSPLRPSVSQTASNNGSGPSQTPVGRRHSPRIYEINQSQRPKSIHPSFDPVVAIERTLPTSPSADHELLEENLNANSLKTTDQRDSSRKRHLLISSPDILSSPLKKKQPFAKVARVEEISRSLQQIRSRSPKGRCRSNLPLPNIPPDSQPGSPVILSSSSTPQQSFSTKTPSQTSSKLPRTSACVPGGTSKGSNTSEASWGTNSSIGKETFS